MAQATCTFRIFVSSTFSDLKEERNALQKYVFPRLRELCARHGCRFQAIDLRWGVREEAALDQQTMRICIEDAATGAPVARFPVPLDHISTFPDGRAWVGTSANHLYIITLEGGEDSSKPKAESAKPDGEESPKSKV